MLKMFFGKKLCGSELRVSLKFVENVGFCAPSIFSAYVSAKLPKKTFCPSSPWENSTKKCGFPFEKKCANKTKIGTHILFDRYIFLAVIHPPPLYRAFTVIRDRVADPRKKKTKKFRGRLFVEC